MKVSEFLKQLPDSPAQRLISILVVSTGMVLTAATLAGHFRGHPVLAGVAAAIGYGGFLALVWAVLRIRAVQEWILKGR